MNFKTQSPILYNQKEECCGCTACYAICPKEAIYMLEDNEGFEYPQINKTKCIQCYQCMKVCPMTTLGSGTNVVNLMW